MHLLRRLGLSSYGLLLSLLLTACGGGGGGGGTAPQPGDPGSTFQVSLSPTSYGARWEEGIPLPSLVVTGTGNGPVPGALFLGTKDQGNAIDHVTVEGTGANAKFTVYVKTGLPLGQHIGTLQFLACRNEACTSHYAGSPVSMPYDITIIKALRIAPTALRLSALSGASPGANVAVELPNGQTDYRVTPAVPWLVVSNQGPTGFTLTAKPMAPGRYQGSVVVYASGRDTPVAVDYEVSGDATTVTSIVPDRASLSLSTLTTGSAAAVLNLTLPSWTSELSASVQTAAGPSGWLSVSKSGERSLAVTASASTLAAGTYQANIVIASGPGIPTVTVPVSFTVGAARWEIHGTTAFMVRGDTTPAQLSSTVLLEVPGLPAQAYSATTTSPWLKLSRAAGSTDSAPLRISIDPAEMLKLVNNPAHTAEIVILPAASALPPLKIAVTLDKALPQLDYVSPHTRLPNEGGIFTLRGRNLGDIVDMANVLQVSGATPTQVTHVNDTTLKVRMQGAASGDVTFSLKNGLGIAAAAPVLSVVPQPALPYAAISSVGEKTGLVFDAQRQTLYSVDRTTEAIMRYRWNGSSWDVTATALPGVDGVALSPDGKILVASAALSNMVLFDPATMARQGTYIVDQIKLNYVLATQRLAVTNDGRVWYAGATWEGISYFDLVTRGRGRFATDRSFGYSNDGPWYSVSGDGSRLHIAIDQFGEPTHYLDDSDGILHASPAGYSYWWLAQTSLRGERFVEEQGRVFDRNFNLVGTLASPDPDYFGQRHAVSPDGSRVYMLAYHFRFANTSVKPRVYVFDSSTPVAPDTKLPVLGYFDIDDYPTCHNGNIFTCKMYAISTTSPDGKTLFFLGNEKLVVAPIPALTPVAPAATSAVSRGAPRMTRMPAGR